MWNRSSARQWVVVVFLGLAIEMSCNLGALRLLVRYDKEVPNYIALLQLACALLWSAASGT